MIENYTDFKKFLSQLKYKPKLLLHSCCAPCSSHTILLLKEYFDITIYYTNDNIYPFEEFDLRAKEQIKFAKNIDDNIKIIIAPYVSKDYDDAIIGKENLGERSVRCYNCYLLRLEKTCKYAKENNFDFFSTTLSISPYKNSEWINKIGYELEKKYNMPYLYSNFKKEEGYKDSIKLSLQYGLYRQDYCGCKYSLEERRQKE